MSNGLISIVVPCYNEEPVVKMFYNELIKVLTQTTYDYEIIFIDDGSKDKTSDIIKEINERDPRVSLISFSRNFGKESAMYAGLEYSVGDLVVVIDSDLQHPPKVILQMIAEIDNGYDTVTTKRIDRNGESKIRSAFSKKFYSIIQHMIDVELVQGAQDFRIMTRPVVDAILSVKEYNRFSKGIFSWVGFKVKYIDVECAPRAAGETKWSFRLLVKYAIEGMLSFSTAPLQFATILGLVISFVSFIWLIQILVQTLVRGIDIPGYTTTIVTVLFIGGVQLLALGIISNYIAKMYMEIKDRPKYIVREHIGSER
jgi:glycosyltransferase involved in cell wall biosynthesis